MHRLVATLVNCLQWAVSPPSLGGGKREWERGWEGGNVWVGAQIDGGERCQIKIQLSPSLAAAVASLSSAHPSGRDNGGLVASRIW